MPEKVTFATRPKQVQAMIERAVVAGVPFAWFAADEEFGQNPGLRTYLETEGIAYAMAVCAPPRDHRALPGILIGVRTHIPDSLWTS